MRRRNAHLEEKIATLHIQLKDKHQALQKMHQDYELTKSNLLSVNKDQGT